MRTAALRRNSRPAVPPVAGGRPGPSTTLLLRDESSRGAVGDLADSVQLLGAIARSESIDRVVRVYRPWPTVAMTRRESLMPGFDAACAAARARGFEPVVRPTGGRAVAYDPSCLVIDIVEAERGGRGDNAVAFVEVGERFVRGLRHAGVDARLGPVPGEYCPGDYSVNARGSVKLVGTAQRVVRGARLVSASLPLGPVDAIADVLTAVNAALDFAWDRRTVGSVGIENPSASSSLVESALVDSIAGATMPGTLAELLRP